MGSLIKSFHSFIKAQTCWLFFHDCEKQTITCYDGRVGSVSASCPVKSWGVGSNLAGSKSDLTLNVTQIDGFQKRTYNRILVYTCVNFWDENGYYSPPIVNMHGSIRCHISCRRWPKSWISIITGLTVLVPWAEEIDYNWYKQTNKQTNLNGWVKK